MSDNFSDPVIYGGNNGERRSVRSAMWRGMKKRCPQCGKGHIFSTYTRVNDYCSECGLHLGGHQADDAPPYFTMLIAGHIVIPLGLEIKRHFHPPVGLQLLAWLVALGVLIWLLLPVTKGALIGVQWANRMHGFSDTPEEDIEESLRITPSAK